VLTVTIVLYKTLMEFLLLGPCPIAKPVASKTNCCELPVPKLKLQEEQREAVICLWARGSK
jgi:hypothetical protein